MIAPLTLWGLPATLLAPRTPLVPGAGEARGDVRRELLRPEYHQRNVPQQVLDWIWRQLVDLLDATSRTPPLSALFALIVLVLLLLGLALLLSRVRRTARAVRSGAVLTDEAVTARDLRLRAEAALADGRPEDAVIDGFRALTLRRAEAGDLEAAAGATAREVAGVLGGLRPERRPDLRSAAEVFDEVRYGDRAATPAAAGAIFALDDALSARPVSSR